MAQALCDLADGYAKEGLWPQVCHTMKPRGGVGTHTLAFESTCFLFLDPTLGFKLGIFISGSPGRL